MGSSRLQVLERCMGKVFRSVVHNRRKGAAECHWHRSWRPPVLAIAGDGACHGCRGVKVNGFPCKSNITTEDFFFAGLVNPGPTNNTFGATITLAAVQQIPGLNTLGMSMARVDYAPGGLNPPHTHPRATEMVFVLEGELDVGFITTDNKLYARIIKKGEIFTFPRGLLHYQRNNGKGPASAIAAFNNQSPGTQREANALFASTPAMEDVVLTKTFQVGTKMVEKMKSRLAPKK